MAESGSMDKDQKPVVHVAFSSSAAGSLEEALGTIGCKDRVINQADDLSFGPISDAGHRERLSWIENELAYDGYEEVLQVDGVFWAEAISGEIYPVVWVNRRCAREYAGFLEFLWRRPDVDFEIIDLTDIVFAGPKGKSFVRAFGELAPDQIVEAGLFRRQAKLSAHEIENYKLAWQQLKTENAPLRIVSAHGLVSAPITYFDEIISSFVPETWTKCAWVIVQVFMEQEAGPFRQAGNLLLSARLRTLAEAGLFEHQGDLTLPRYSEVRSHTRA